ncbi:MAG: dihydrolipoyllysine-residue succinyltransferase [Verrucomicrobiota bacterium]|nr:dihydrolipoyllysine-residue succinyltransferase [Verrucomicrobiota bacterium]
MELKIPQMGESVVTVTIGALLKTPGSFVSAGEEILEMETDKVNQVLTAPVSGLLELSCKSGDTVPIGGTIGSIQEGRAPLPQETTPAPTPAPTPVKEEIAPQPIPVPQEIAPPPALQEIAIPPAPPCKEEMAPVPPRVKESDERRERMSRLRLVIAERLVKVKNETAMLTTFNEVDMSAIIAVREKEQEAFVKRHGVKLGFMSFFVKASVAALAAFPEVGARIEGEEIVFPNKAHIGVAVSTDRGLMVPVLRNATDLSFADIEKQLKEAAEAARKGTLAIEAMQGGTFTITNGGVFGSLLSTPILNPPQSAILGMHAICKRPIAIEDKVVIRPMMYLALSYDHRIVDGKEAIEFLVHIKKDLESPERLLLSI